MRAIRLDSPLTVDGKLEEAVYGRVPGVSGFIQAEPRPGEPATEKTEVWVLFDDRNVYVSARCWDSHPERMVMNEMRRDNTGIFGNETLTVILDTFYDRRNAFFFYTNPLGALSDSVITDERNINRDWNTVWSSKASRFTNGWTLEMAFPFKSLRYRTGGSQIWGINFRRVVRWKNELSYLAPVPPALGAMGYQQSLLRRDAGGSGDTAPFQQPRGKAVRHLGAGHRSKRRPPPSPTSSSRTPAST